MKELFKLVTDKKIKFDEAIEYFKNRVPMKPDEFNKISKEYKALAFTVSGYTKIQILKKFYDELLKALEDGKTVTEFKNQMNDFLQKKGYEGITNFQADNIFRTNIQTAYQAGHYKQMTSTEVMRLRPYWQYDSVNDGRTRPTHLAMDGRVFKADDSIWDTWYPPNGYRCRCTIRTLSERQLKQQGLQVESDYPLVQPDKNFDINSAKAAFKPDMENYPEVFKKAFKKRENH